MLEEIRPAINLKKTLVNQPTIVANILKFVISRQQENYFPGLKIYTKLL